MKKILFVLCLFTVIASSSLYADFSVSPGIKFMSGESTYTIYPSPYKSQLKFPLDFKLLSLEVGYHLKETPLHFFVEFNLPLEKKANDKMWDFDWNSSVLISETKSDTELKGFSSKISLIYDWMDLLKNNDYRLELSFSAAFTLQYWDFELYGTEGTSNISSDTLVGTYKIYHFIYYIGPQFNFYFLKNFKLTAEADLASLYSSDEDDHVLRYKKSKTLASGIGYRLFLAASYTIVDTWSLIASFEYLRINASTGHQDQSWYGNDPLLAGDETGSSENNIDAEILLKQSNFSIRLQKKF